MGAGKDNPPILTPRVEGYEAVLRLQGYPAPLWGWLSEWARVLHRMRHKLVTMTEADWLRATGKRWQDLRPEDLR